MPTTSEYGENNYKFEVIHVTSLIEARKAADKIRNLKCQLLRKDLKRKYYVIEYIDSFDYHLEVHVHEDIYNKYCQLIGLKR